MKNKKFRVVTNGLSFKVQASVKVGFLICSKMVWRDLGSPVGVTGFIPKIYETKEDAQKVCDQKNNEAEKLHEWREV